ncbi:MAG: hypothetical protein WBD26_05870 [Candidatus Acidiferrales bacterium]
MTKLRTRVAGILLVMLIVPAYALAQQQDKTSADESTRLRLDILLSEYDGSKQVNSLPYTLFLEASPHGARPRSVRMGLKIPIVVNTSSTNQQVSYQDIGTDIDARGTTLADGLYDLDMNVDRSSVYSANQGTDESGRIPQVGGSPVVRSFRSSFDLGLRDGHTEQGPSATDPFNGHVLKISITLHVVK